MTVHIRFVAGLSRPQIKQLVATMVDEEPVGAFLIRSLFILFTSALIEFVIRDVQSQPDSFGVTVKVGQRKIKNFLLKNTPDPNGRHISYSKEEPKY